MFFYPVMLSPVVIANIWHWILHRKGVLNQGLGSGADTMTALSNMAGFDIIATVIIGILLLVTAQRTLRSNKDPSLIWASGFALVFFLLTLWANPIQLLLPDSGLTPSLIVALVIVFLFLWLLSSAHKASAIAVAILSVAAVAMLLTIQFDTVFNFEKFRPVNWLVQRNTGWPFFWLVFVFTWSHMGFYMLILLAGLQAIPSDLYEAAKMDAGRPVRVFFKITLPLITPTLTVVIVLSLIRSFQVFDEVYLLTGGGPGRETFMVVQNIFETAFTGENPKYGAAAAGSVLMAIVIAVFTFMQLFLTRRQSQL
ncbi:MAG: sugar ABC transporter permease [Gammaproteobacteria bacterium]|nr:sugar ABC transporter permease [Gammaproteobacteria bacterium]